MNPVYHTEQDTSPYQSPVTAPYPHSSVHSNRPSNNQGIDVHRANDGLAPLVHPDRSRLITTPAPAPIERRWSGQSRAHYDHPHPSSQNNPLIGYDSQKPESRMHLETGPPASNAQWPSRSRGHAHANGDSNFGRGDDPERKARELTGWEPAHAQASDARDRDERAEARYGNAGPLHHESENYSRGTETYDEGLDAQDQYPLDDLTAGDSKRSGSLLERIVRQEALVMYPENGAISLRDRITSGDVGSTSAGDMGDSLGSDSGDEPNATPTAGGAQSLNSGGRKRRKSRRKGTRR